MPHRVIGRVATSLILLLPGLCLAEVPLNENGKLTVFGDFRTRLEADWDSRKSDGTKRDDRTRLRIRGRLGVNAYFHDDLQLQFRIATGPKHNQQSTNITIHDFDNNSTGDKDVNIDRAFLKKTIGNGHVWIGKNALPAWKQNAVFWDDDAPVAGIGVAYAKSLETVSLGLNGGYFLLPIGTRNYAGRGTLGQAKIDTTLGGIGVTLAGTAILIDADPDDRDAERLLDDNDSRDYSLFIASLQARTDLAGRPLRLSIDVTHNWKDYDATATDAFTSFHRNDTDGVFAEARWGDTKSRGSWQTGIAYSRIEMFGVHNSYSQDDATRWGANDQARVSNHEGPEFRFGLGLGGNQKVVARLFLMEAIKDRAPGDADKEDGNRFRVDYSVSF